MDNLFSRLSLLVGEVISSSEFAFLELISLETVAQEDVARLSSLDLDHVVMVVLVFFLGLGKTMIWVLNNLVTYQNMLLGLVLHGV
jgi:hypothetical protein